jgi:hypothetical protein
MKKLTALQASLRVIVIEPAPAGIQVMRTYRRSFDFDLFRDCQLTA